MELGTQIKKYRQLKNMSQDALADMVFVSRQTVSNWETGKTYPDIESLLRLSEAFSVSLDDLIKGDVEKMKNEISREERAGYERDCKIFTALFAAMVILPVPFAMLFKWWGIAAWLGISAVGVYFAFRVEWYKKKFDIQTYKEIVAFSNGATLSEIEKAREAGKRPYQKALLAAASAAVTLIAALLMSYVFR